MESFRSVVEIVALISASALCVYLIVVLVRVREILAVLQKDLADIGEKARPVLENMHVITESLKSISSKVDDHVGLVKGSLESVKQAADNIVAFEQRVQDSIEEPLMRFTSVAGALLGRITAWFGGSRQQS